MALVSRAEAAQALEVAPTRINKWVADGCPVADRGVRGRGSKYDIDAIRAWLKARSAGKDSGLSLERERAKLTRAQLEKASRENRLRAGELVERRDVVEAGVLYTKAWTAKVRGLPRKLTQAGIITRTQEAAVALLCRDLLREIADWDVQKTGVA